MQITEAWRSVVHKAVQWVRTFDIRDGWTRDTRKWWLGGGTDAGIHITPEVALQSATVASCANLIGTTIAHLGYDIYRERRSGSIEVATAHELHEILKWEPNRNQVSDEFWQRLHFDQDLRGNAYAQIQRLRSGGIVSLKAWDAERTEIDTKANPRDWTYKFQPDNGSPEVRISEHDPDENLNILHLRNVTLDGVYGLSTVALARQRIALDLAVEKYGAMFFGKGGRVKDVFEFAQVLKPEQRAQFKRLFAEHYGNLDASHEALLLEAGVRYSGKSGATPNEAQFLETQTATAIAICRFFGVPPTLVGILDRATYNNQEQLMLQFLQLCLTPRVSRAEKSLRRALLTKQEKRSGYSIHCKLQKLLRADTRTRGEFYKTLATLGAINANEIRELEDMPRIEDPAADEYRRAANLFGPDDEARAAGADAGREAAEEETRRAAA